MKARAWILAIAVMFLNAFLYPRTYQEGQNQRIQKDIESKSLIRKDLLETSNRKLLPPKRNIFTQQRTNLGAEGSAFPGADRSQSPQGVQSQTDERVKNEEIFSDLIYIGYVNSEQRVVALIVFMGRTYAVESGDILEGGINIGEITPDDVEISGPDSQSRKVKLEGEEP